TTVPAPGLDSTVDGSAEGVEPVHHALQPRAISGCGGVEAGSVVDDLEGEFAVRLSQADLGSARPRVFRDVVERFECAEVHGGLDILRLPAEVLHGAPGWRGPTPRPGLEGR